MAINSLKQPLLRRYYSVMFNLLLVIIYLAFISLGLPDALLGAAWPSIYPVFNVPVSYAGIISFIISFCTIISSLLSDRLTRKLGTGRVTLISVFLTAVAIFGFSISSSFLQMCLWALPYGLGAGSVDAALNNYVAIHYKSRHMSWLHSMWGIGASLGPYIMGFVMTHGSTYKSGYRVISFLQAALTVILLFSLKLWKTGAKDKEEEKANALTLREVLSIRGVREILVMFFTYCAIESTTGLWASSYLTLYKGIAIDKAASYASMFYIGITIGRVLSGFISMKLTDDKMVRLGQCGILLGIILLFLPLGEVVSVIAFVVTGLGCAPIYPSILHSTPSHFGAENSQAVIGIQMATAYIGSSFMPPIFGLIAEHISLSLLPYYLVLLLTLMALMQTFMLRKIRKGSLTP